MNAQRSPDYERQLRADIGSFSLDPLGYVLYAFPWGVKGTILEKEKLRTWQRKLLTKLGELLRAGMAFDEAVSKVIRMARASGHGIGKSGLVAMIIKWAFDTFEDTRGIVTANTDTQLRTKTWPEVTKWHLLSLTRHWADITATALISKAFGHDKSWRIDAVPWSENNTEAFAGLHNLGKRLILVFDEASAIADKVWEVAEGALTDLGTQIIWLVFGNATRAEGRFRECFRKEAKRWDHEQIDSRTVEGVNLVEINEMVAIYGEDSDRVKIRVRGIFPNMSAKQFISESDVDAAFGKHLRPEQYNWAPVILTCDPAWEGDDDLIIAKRQGLMFKILEVIPKNNNDVEIAQKLARYEDKERADAVFVDAGYGTGIVSVGSTWNREWQLVWFSGASADPACLNKRAEMINAIPYWLQAGGAIEADLELREELIAQQTKPRMDGKIQIESKDEIKKRLGRSPNRADCLGLSFAYPVQCKPRNADGTPMLDTRDNNYARSVNDEPDAIYNPMERL